MPQVFICYRASDVSFVEKIISFFRVGVIRGDVRTIKLAAPRPRTIVEATDLPYTSALAATETLITRNNRKSETSTKLCRFDQSGFAGLRPSEKSLSSKEVKGISLARAIRELRARARASICTLAGFLPPPNWRTAKHLPEAQSVGEVFASVYANP
jgi:hypothetical protein